VEQDTAGGGSEAHLIASAKPQKPECKVKKSRTQATRAIAGLQELVLFKFEVDHILRFFPESVQQCVPYSDDTSRWLLVRVYVAKGMHD
jgi:hypothetical protein